MPLSGCAKMQLSHPPNPRRAKTRLVPGKAAARSTARRIMSAMFADAGETVSRQCLASTPLADFCSILLFVGEVLSVVHRRLSAARHVKFLEDVTEIIADRLVAEV